MKIVFFVDTYFPHLNGVTVSVDLFSKKLRGKANEVYVFAPKIKGYKNTNPFVHLIPSSKIPSLPDLVRLPMLLPSKSYLEFFKVDADLVHAHGNGLFSLLGLAIARMKKIPYILTFHSLHTRYTHYFFNGAIKPDVVAKALKTFANLSDGIIVPSEKMKQELISCGVSKKITIIPNFVESEKFNIKKDNFLHRLCQIPDSAPILLSVGRLGKEKNFKFLIQVFQKLSQKETSSHLVIVGEGGEKESLQLLASKLGIEKRVHFPGNIDHEKMPSVYKDSYLFLFASDTETQGVCVLEAAAAGLPLIVLSDLAFKGMVIEGENGFLLPENIDTFVEKINLLLEDSLLYKKFSQNSIIIAKNNFNPEVVITSLLNYYHNLLSLRPQKDQKNKDI